MIESADSRGPRCTLDQLLHSLDIQEASVYAGSGQFTATLILHGKHPVASTHPVPSSYTFSWAYLEGEHRGHIPDSEVAIVYNELLELVGETNESN